MITDWLKHKSKTLLKGGSHPTQEKITGGEMMDDTVTQMSLELKKRYQKAVSPQDVASFYKQASDLIITHLEATEFLHHKPLMKEMKFFIHYIFMLIQDDFFLGDQVLSEKMTRIDDYIFSQYRKNEALAYHIKKLTTLAYSNRFDKEPKINFLSYFVFLEENGIEFIELLQDFYKMLQSTQGQNKWFSFNKKAARLHKSYKKKVEDEKNGIRREEQQTLWTVNPSFVENSKQVQIKIYRDNLKEKNYAQNNAQHGDISDDDADNDMSGIYGKSDSE